MQSFKRICVVVVAILIVTTMSVSLCGCNKDDSYDPTLYLHYDSKTDYGLYFYGPNHATSSYVDEENGYTYFSEDMLRSSKEMPIEYFDPSKPTMIWIHGWEPTYSSSDRGLSLSGDGQGKAGLEAESFVARYKALGYNVATFQYQNSDLSISVAGKLETIMKSAFKNVNNTGEAMGYLFASELCLNLGENYNQEISYIGHSCGSFVTLSVNYYIQYFLQQGYIRNSHLLASRISLVDPYFNGISEAKFNTIYLTNEDYKNTAKNVFCMNIINSLAEKNNVAFDVYLAMGFASSSFYSESELNTETFFNSVAANCAIVNMAGLRNNYGDNNIHVLTRDWFLKSMLEEKLTVDDTSAIGPSLACSTSEILSMKGKQYDQTCSTIDFTKEKLAERSESVFKAKKK